MRCARVPDPEGEAAGEEGPARRVRSACRRSRAAPEQEAEDAGEDVRHDQHEGQNPTRTTKPNSAYRSRGSPRPSSSRAATQIHQPGPRRSCGCSRPRGTRCKSLGRGAGSRGRARHTREGLPRDALAQAEQEEGEDREEDQRRPAEEARGCAEHRERGARRPAIRRPQVRGAQ